MEVPSIFGHSYPYCFYNKKEHLALLPVGTINTKLPPMRAYDTEVCVGTSDLYDKNINNYAPSVTLESFRNRLINGEPIDDIFITDPEVEMPRQYTDAENATINKYREEIIKLSEQKSKQATDRMIRNIQIKIESKRHNLFTYVNSLERKYANEQPPAKKKLVHKNKETPEISEVREQISVERMGLNRFDVIQTLNAKLNRLEMGLVEVVSEPVVEKTDSIINENNIFDQLVKLQWADKDERTMTPNVLHNLPYHILVHMYPVMQQMASKLQTAIGKRTGVVENMDFEDRQNFLFHVIAKGANLYYQSLLDPDFCLYLVDNWQPLHTMLFKKISK